MIRQQIEDICYVQSRRLLREAMTKKTQPAQSAIHSGLSGRRCCRHDKEKRNARVSRHITQSIESTQSAAQ